MTQEEQTPAPATSEWIVEDEFSLGLVCVRVFRHADAEDTKVVFAETPEGLDLPGAFTVERLWDLHRAMVAASLILETVWSASVSEERTVNREFARLGVRGLHAFPKADEWSLLCDEKGISEPPRRPIPDDQAEGVVVTKFEVDGLYGRVDAPKSGDRDFHQVRLANSPYDLDTVSGGLVVPSHSAAYKALHTASALIELARFGDDLKVVTYRGMLRMGVRLLDN